MSPGSRSAKANTSIHAKIGVGAMRSGRRALRRSTLGTLRQSESAVVRPALSGLDEGGGHVAVEGAGAGDAEDGLLLRAQLRDVERHDNGRVVLLYG